MNKITEETYKYVVSFHMKSGKCFYMFCDECEVKYNGGSVTAYTTSGQDPRFKIIDLTQVECLLMDTWEKPRGVLVN